MKYRIFFSIVITILLLAACELFSQDYDMPYRSKLEITAGEGYIYDNGGVYGGYQDLSSDTLIIRPENPGQYVQIQTNSFDVDIPDDYLDIYSGDNTVNKFNIDGAVPTTTYSLDNSGALTLIFISNEKDIRPGFKIYYSTIEELPEVDLEIYTHRLDKNVVSYGEPINLTLVLRNNGPDVANNYKIDYYLSADKIFEESDLLLDTKAISQVNNGSLFSSYSSLIIPSDTPINEYYIIGRISDVMGDMDNISSNSQFHEKIQVVEPSVDIWISNVSQETNLLCTSFPHEITYRLNRLGNIQTTDVNTCFHLSENTTIDDSDLYLGTSSIPELFNEFSFTTTFKIDTIDFSQFEEGIYYLIISADSDSTFDETDESNNKYLTQVFLDKSLKIKKNLSITDITLSADTITTGHIQNISYRIKSENIIDRTEIRLYLSADTVLNTEHDQLLRSTNTYSFTDSIKTLSIELNLFPFEGEGYIEGTYYLIAHLDPENEFQENNEIDNIKYSQVYITNESYWDLGFGDYTIKSDSLLSTYPLRWYVDIFNNSSAATENQKVCCYLSEDDLFDENDLFICAESIDNIDPGTTWNRSLYYSNLHLHTPGDYHIICKLDTLNVLDETDESNNTLVIPFKILDPSLVDSFDLEILEVIAPDTISLNSYTSVGFKYFLYNNVRTSINGAVYLSKDSILNIEDLGSKLFVRGFYSETLQELSYVYNIRITNQDTGMYYLIAKGDDYNYLNEDNESNNIAIKPIYVYNATASDLLFDLEIKELNISNTVLNSGATLFGQTIIRPIVTNNTDSCFLNIYIAPIGSPLNKQLMFTDTLYDVGYAEESVNFSFDLPSSIENGTYIMEALISTNKDSRDKNLENNSSIRHFSVQTPNLDYAIESITILESSVYQNENLGVEIAVINHGTTLPSSPLCSYYISEDNLLSDEDILVSSEILSDFGIQQSVKITHNISNLSTITAGNYNLIVVLDQNNKYDEFDESNNVLSATFTLNIPGANLIIKSASTDQTQISKGVNFNISYVLANIGNYSAYYPYTYLYLSKDSIYDTSDQSIGYRGHSTISAGAEDEQNISGLINNSTTNGSYYLVLVADRTNRVSESNEDDNTLALPIEVISPDYDLEIISSNIQDTLKTIESSRNYITLDIKNDGLHDITEFISIYKYISADSIFDPFADVFLGSDQTREYINAGTIVSQSVAIDLPDLIEHGQCWIFFLLDAEGDAEETDESNNTFGIPMVVADMDVDLMFSNFELSMDTISIKSEVDINFTFQNLGTTYAQDAIRTTFYISSDSILDATDQQVNDYLYNPIDGQSQITSSRTIYYLYFQIPGTYYIIGTLDDREQINETNENNNTAFDSIIVVPEDIDLHYGEIYLANESAVPGENLKITVWVNNSGLADANSSFKSGYYFSTDTIYDDSDTYIEYDYISSLGSHTLRSDIFYYNVPELEAGTYYILFRLDYENRVHETNELNNTSHIEFIVKPTGIYPDYAISDVEFHYTQDDGKIIVDFAVENIGGSAPENSCYCDIMTSEELNYYESHFTLNSLSITPLEPGEKKNIHLENEIPDEYNKYLIINVDPFETVDDRNRENNVEMFGIESQELPFDLSLNCILSKQVYHPANTISIQSTINWQGEFPIDSVLISYYIARDSIIEFAEAPILSKMIKLNKGEITLDEFTYKISETADLGTYYAMIQLNKDSIWIEKEIRNNTYVLEFSIQPGASTEDINLSIPYGINSIHAGDTINQFCNVENLGNYDLDNISLDYYLSIDATIDESDIHFVSGNIDILKIDSSTDVYQEIIIPESTIPGDYTVIIKALFNEEENTTTDNNIALSYYQISAPVSTFNHSEEPLISVYPNPATSYANVKSTVLIDEYKILSLDGRIIECHIANDEELRIDIETFTPGLYFIKIKSGDFVQTMKLEKK